MRLSEQEKAKYQSDGYLLIKGCLDTSPIDEMMDFVAHVIGLEANEEGHYECSREYLLNEALIALKKKNPSSSSWIYQTILNSYKLKKLFIELNIAPLAMELLGITEENNLGTVSPAFRFDIPGDNVNARKWHQDGNYFLENQRGDQHLVAWIPMNKATKTNGSVIMAVGSHQVGKQVASHERAKEYASEQFVSNEADFLGYQHVQIEADKGDIAFINMDLHHTSGDNVSLDQVRYTAQIRFNTINTSDYRPVMLSAQYPQYNRNVRGSRDSG